MFAKRLFLKATNRNLPHEKGWLASKDLDFRINIHYGIPSTASILAFDPIQKLLAIGTLDGRIKIIGGDNIEALLISSKLLPYKYLAFLQNQGFLISITNDNVIQAWNLESRSVTCSLQWKSNVTAFSVIDGSSFMYVGDEYGLVSVLKYDVDAVQLLQLPYHLPFDSLADAAGYQFSYLQPVVGVLPQPSSSGNRLLIAYENGLIILWDVTKSQIVVLHGDKVLQLKNNHCSPNKVDASIVDEISSNHSEEKEIGALCWASNDGSILAVGYVDGDILLWNSLKATSNKEKGDIFFKNVVKLQLSSAQKRLPVVVLHWLTKNKSSNQRDGQLLIYGGDEIGCEEVITVVSLEWASDMESIRCVGRVDITLAGSFSDMILTPSSGTMKIDENASLFVLSHPGLMHVYDGACLSSSSFKRRKELPASAVKFPVAVQTIDPLMIVAELFQFDGGVEGQSKIVEMMHHCLAPTFPGSKKWNLTGGINNHVSLAKDSKFHKLYITGYEDGSIRIWDATYPVFSPVCVLTAECQAFSENVVNSSAPVTKLDFCSSTLRLAVGNECGLVKLYNLCGKYETSFHYFTEVKHEVIDYTQVQGPRCEAVLNLHKSGVQALKFMNKGTKLIVGFAFTRIAVLDVNSSSFTFITDSLSNPNSPVISVLSEAFVYAATKNIDESAPIFPDNHRKELLFVLTKDANIHVINSTTGSKISSRSVHPKRKSSAISMYFIESEEPVSRSVNEEHFRKDEILSKDLSQNCTAHGIETSDIENHYSDRKTEGQSLKEFLLLLCCKDALRLYDIKSVVHGENKSLHKVKLAKSCCWTTILRKDEKVCGLALFYQTGELEIRGFPDLEIVREYSLMSDLRWSFQANMERTFSSVENGEIAMVNGHEVAFISLLEGENYFRIPESLPNLHDEVLAAAANTAMSVSSNSKEKQGDRHPVILRGIVKGFKGQKLNKSAHVSSTSKYELTHLENIFMKNPFPEPLTTTYDKDDPELTIDDIEIDEPVPFTSTLSHEINDKDKKTEREKLLDDASDVKPSRRTREEIEAKYRKTGDASSVAGEARNKLLERQQKLEKTRRQTEELQNEAKEFASLTNELVKAMENRKWYHI